MTLIDTFSTGLGYVPEIEEFQNQVHQSPAFKEHFRAIWDTQRTCVSTQMIRLLLGPPGVGKSTLISYYLKLVRADYVSKGKPDPVVYVSLDAKLGVRGILENIALAIGDPPSSASAPVLGKRIRDYAHELGKELIIIDEAQHALPGNTSLRLQEAADAFKVLTQNNEEDKTIKRGLPLILAGTPELFRLLNESVSKDSKEEQFQQRCEASILIKPPLKANSREWKSILAAYEKKCPRDIITLTESEVARRFFAAAQGNYRRTRKILVRALDRADPCQQVRLKDLGEAYDYVEAKKIFTKNPFTCDKNTLDKMVVTVENKCRDSIAVWDDIERSKINV